MVPLRTYVLKGQAEWGITTRRKWRSAKVYRVVVAEYLSLGLLASAVALILATAAAWAVARFVFEGSFALPLLSMAGLTLMVVTLTVLIGLANSRDVVRRTPLEVLRQEA